MKISGEDIKQRFSLDFERRRLARLSIASEQFKYIKINRLFSVFDLSLQTMGLWIIDSEDFKSFIVGFLIEGYLNLKREKIFVKSRVRSITFDRVTCEFEGLSKNATTFLTQFLSPAFLGSTLKPIPSVEPHTLWYHGFSYTDLLLRRALDGSFQNFILYALGFFVQWDAHLGLQTGMTEFSEQKSEIHGILRLQSVFLNPDSSIALEKLEIAKTTILSSNLTQDLKVWCARQLSI